MLFIILVTAIKGRPTPEIRLFPEQLRLTLLPKERYGDSLSGRWSNTIPSNWAGGHYHWATAAPAKCSSPMPRCQVMLWCAVGALLKKQRYKKKD